MSLFNCFSSIFTSQEYCKQTEKNSGWFFFFFHDLMVSRVAKAQSRCLENSQLFRTHHLLSPAVAVHSQTWLGSRIQAILGSSPREVEVRVGELAAWGVPLLTLWVLCARPNQHSGHEKRRLRAQEQRVQNSLLCRLTWSTSTSFSCRTFFPPFLFFFFNRRATVRSLKRNKTRTLWATKEVDCGRIWISWHYSIYSLL